ncbi:MAG: GtrA family protein [Chromatiaceae bacterium]|nr:MAG: GtrA family protein [Chromatiaceae bacterium]
MKVWHPFQVRHELLLVSRFAVVGLLATAVHASTAWGLITLAAMPAIPANSIAFLLAFSVSLVGHYVWTFSAPGDPARAMRRFLTVAVSGFGLNTVVLSFLLKADVLSPATAAVLSVFVVPPATFIASRAWAFRVDAGACPLSGKEP